MYTYPLQIDSCLRDGEGGFLAVSYGCLSVQRDRERREERRMRGMESRREGGNVV